jgi:EAL domain-containing protein (putative c-di-GMP-specific phosphodiesterase class I)
MAAPEITCAFMESLQNSGVAFALDDFGAGFTSFRYLRDFFFDIVKLDRSFITGIDRNPDNQACVAALQTLAAHFEMFSVAEGIETPAEAATLTRFGIDCFQGYLYGAPATLPTGAKQRKRA